MSSEFKMGRFFVIMAVLAFVVCGVTAFFTHRAAHGRTADERSAYGVGEKAGEGATPGEKLPTDFALNVMAQQYFAKEGCGEPMTWKSGFEHGYTDGFKKTHPTP
ncbi:MAG TPA: hypothetical protein VK474_01510 [Chthoniobacterales bacterium]|nr:hypothetical protein [Chthoniobacterales bacterium]